MQKLFLFLCIISLAGCARMCASCDRSFQNSDRSYVIEQYSGGQLISTWSFRGILNNQDNSDGYYFYQGDTLVEIGGDLIIKSVD